MGNKETRLETVNEAEPQSGNPSPKRNEDVAQDPPSTARKRNRPRRMCSEGMKYSLEKLEADPIAQEITSPTPNIKRRKRLSPPSISITESNFSSKEEEWEQLTEGKTPAFNEIHIVGQDVLAAAEPFVANIQEAVLGAMLRLPKRPGQQMGHVQQYEKEMAAMARKRRKRTAEMQMRLAERRAEVTARHNCIAKNLYESQPKIPFAEAARAPCTGSRIKVMLKGEWMTGSISSVTKSESARVHWMIQVKLDDGSQCDFEFPDDEVLLHSEPLFPVTDKSHLVSSSRMFLCTP
mmetsp:Transcript_2581/g.5884  ORF Transcript_2581/g.5884 Transcript_2581/m.5884 type:complete len:293 (+) Transcript_2581:296-1174(+)